MLEGENWDVVVGGLGLGYTAAAALESGNVNSLVVVELFPQVIDWHLRGLVPCGEGLSGDPRCRLIEQDFFTAAVDQGIGLDPRNPGKKFHAILLDIDHTPTHQLDDENTGFYSEKGLNAMADQLLPGSVFGLWSDDAQDDIYIGILHAFVALALSSDTLCDDYDNCDGFTTTSDDCRRNHRRYRRKAVVDVAITVIVP